MDQQLEVFVTVAEKENFSRAAEELHMTQPAVSQYIRSFERIMGTKLLERTNKYVRLNKAGEIVYHHAKEILGLYTKMHYLIDDLTNNTSGPLSIGASYTFGEYVLPHVLAKMKESFPFITPSVTIGNTKDIAELVLGHQLDVGIVEGQYEDKNLVIHAFSEDSMCVVASPQHPLSEKEEVSLEDLANETWIIREKGSGTREAAERMFHTYHIKPKKSLEFGSTQLIKESVEAGLGIALLSDWTIHKENANGTLTILPASAISIKRQFSTVLQSPFQTKALQVFLDTVTNKETLSEVKNDFYNRK
ncbi:LysR family transcriptional regulator [Alteribacillus iranensis]|uniref:DNA-binding transcriptional regulator, LysR family n=1 Tax=Alteribacillus iranensis TaxID=930128 RepID=A0A1I2CYQ8_9BACI|nr:LysR family transcriptional regulator [Alteribacillus iranensis]SFE73394.1 DNA-binding transcriptional regulator, LysR family [Alteribacillus iranensis]